MVLVKVYRITSTTDPETGKPGKVVEFTVFRKPARVVAQTPQDETMRLAQGMFVQLQSVLQSIGFPSSRDHLSPKLTVLITEDEEVSWNVDLHVNDVYEMEFKNGSIVLRKV